jgi:hypothetical protein
MVAEVFGLSPFAVAKKERKKESPGVAYLGLCGSTTTQ